MQLSFVKIGLAVPKITLGQPLVNAKEIISIVETTKSFPFAFPGTYVNRLQHRRLDV